MPSIWPKILIRLMVVCVFIQIALIANKNINNNEYNNEIVGYYEDNLPVNINSNRLRKYINNSLNYEYIGKDDPIIVVYITSNCATCRSKCGIIKKLLDRAADLNYRCILVSPLNINDIELYCNYCKINILKVARMVDDKYVIAKSMRISKTPYIGLINNRILVTQEASRIISIMVVDMG